MKVITTLFLLLSTVTAAPSFSSIHQSPLDPIHVTFECTNRLDGNYPDPENCGQFYSCSGEVKWILHCPDDLHYNPNSNKCEYPDIVNCPNYLTSSSSKEEPVHVMFECSNRPDGNYPDSENCGQFYSCSGEVKWVLRCPDNLHYNPNANKCEYPDIVNCPNYLSSSLTRSMISDAEAYNCTGKPDGLHYHPCDCTKFIGCADGVAHEMTCPRCPRSEERCPDGETWFDKKSRTCAYPGDSKCVVHDDCEVNREVGELR